MRGKDVGVTRIENMKLRGSCIRPSDKEDISNLRPGMPRGII
jgi:hypothetical protein